MKKTLIIILLLNIILILFSAINTMYKAHEQTLMQNKMAMSRILQDTYFANYEDIAQVARECGGEVCWCIVASEAVLKVDPSGHVWRVIHGIWRRIPKVDWSIACRNNYLEVTKYNRSLNKK